MMHIIVGAIVGGVIGFLFGYFRKPKCEHDFRHLRTVDKVDKFSGLPAGRVDVQRCIKCGRIKIDEVLKKEVEG